VLWPEHGDYAQIVRWNGALGDFTVLGSANLGKRPESGDVLKAEIIGDTIRVYINGAEATTSPSPLQDATWSSGSPGIGFFTRNPAQNSNYCWTHIVAADSGSGDVPRPPVVKD
jgi:hypothetical protein